MAETPMDEIPRTLARDPRLDRVVARLDDLADVVLSDRRVRHVLTGEWLGHPLHPMLTDLPVGFWTSAFVLDLGGRRTRAGADVMVAAGLLSALPTAAAGLADWRSRSRGERRVGAAHAVANGAATLLYAGSLGHRMRGNRVRGVLLGMAGAAAASAGGFLGGHLAFSGEELATAEHHPDRADEVVDQQGVVLDELHATAG